MTDETSFSEKLAQLPGKRPEQIQQPLRTPDPEAGMIHCKHCRTKFRPRRANHELCKDSCRVLASNKRRAADPYKVQDTLEIYRAASAEATAAEIAVARMGERARTLRAIADKLKPTL